VAKPKKDADRRAVVEQMRREQQRKERRKSLMVLGSAVMVGVVIIGFAVWQFLEAEQESDRALADYGVAASGASCQDRTTEKATGNNDHRTEGQPIGYDQAPPAMGPHWPQFLVGNQIRSFWSADDRPPLERLVHSLEHGHTILWYDETVADDEAALEELEGLAARAHAETAGKFMAAPWSEADGEPFPDGTHLALTHWSVNQTAGDTSDDVGVWQYCGELSGEVVQEFVDDFPPSDAPEPNAA
jgi:hypothetical protein